MAFRRKHLGRVGVVLLIVAQLAVLAQGCLQAAGGNRTPFRDHNGSPQLPNGTQAIITSYKFRCCGNITAWQTYVHPGGGGHQGAYDITFQVWRPSPTVQETGCYSLVGENIFTSISLYSEGLVSETPEPSNTLTVQPEDVVGYFAFNNKGTGSGIQLDDSQSVDNVWYDTITESGIQPTNCPLPVGRETSRILISSTNAAPVLSVDVSSYTCPPTLTISAASSSSLLSSQPSSMTALTISVLTQISSTISQRILTSTPLPSGTSEPSVVPSLSTDESQKMISPSDMSRQSASDMSRQSASPTSDMSQQSVSPTSDMSQQSASPTSAMSQQSVSPTSAMSQQSVSPTSDISQQSAGPTSDMSQQSASPTPDLSQQPTSLSSDMSPVPSSNRLTSVVAPVVVIVVSVLLVVVVLVLLLWRRKRRRRTQNNMKAEVSVNDTNFFNPNYESCDPDVVTTTYESLGTEEPADYMEPTSSCTTVADYMEPMSSCTTVADSPCDIYAYIPNPRSKGDEKISPELTSRSDEDALYHMVGPNGSSNGCTSLPPLPPPVPMRKGSGHEGLGHILEGSFGYSSELYDDITQPRGREHNSMKKKEMIGNYEPTEKERRISRPNYDKDTPVAYNRPNLNFFVEDEIYWAPACTTSGLYGQLASKRYREIQRDQVRVMEQLGSGQFGEVCKALWTVDGQERELAVKTLKSGASEADKVKFLQEAAINGQFSHSNVIKMYGIITLGEPVLICLEILVNGDLRSYLQGLNLSGSKHGDFMEAQIMFLKFAKDIAAGMEYLSKKSFVHRDLAARNLLLDKSLTCKVADFGMARDLMDDTYYTSSGGQIPVKWTAPEALLYKKYSADSDVWSYGMVLFEIWSVGKKPFSTTTNDQVLRLIQKGFCQAPPPGCPRAVYELMVDCWNPDRPSRPSFSKICSTYLQQSSARILYWAPENETLSPAVYVCGAPLEEGCKLHFDLQEKYKNCEKIF